MLKEALNLIDQKNFYSDSFISRELNIPENMAHALVEDLIRMGYLVEEMGSPNCETTCGGCPYASSCNSNPVKTFHVSAKGKELLKSM